MSNDMPSDHVGSTGPDWPGRDADALPTDLSAMLEAVEKYMGEQFTEMLAGVISRSRHQSFERGYLYGDRRARDFA